MPRRGRMSAAQRPEKPRFASQTAETG